MPFVLIISFLGRGVPENFSHKGKTIYLRLRTVTERDTKHLFSAPTEQGQQNDEKKAF